MLLFRRDHAVIVSSSNRFARLAALAVIVLSTISVVMLAGKPAKKDFIAYWSAAHQFVQHHDPYSRSEVFALELSDGLDAARPLIMRNPPWTLLLTYPLGFLSPRLGLLLWMAATLGTVLLCFRVFRVPARDRLLGFCFAPVYACFAVGQSSAFLLLGFTLFVRLYRRRPFLAGCALTLMTIKPHLFLVLWPVVLIDSLYRRSYRLLAGLAASLCSACSFVTWFSPHIWARYVSMLRTAALYGEFVPTPARSLQLLVAPHHPELQFLPCAMALLWAVQFYWQRRDRWNWATEATPLLLTAIVVSPYAWMTDEIMLLPAMMEAIAARERPHQTFAIFMACNTIALAMLLGQVQLSSGAYLWTSTAWFALYCLSRIGPAVAHQKSARELAA